jgi:DNA-binding LytR/AlgR family response regulator
MKTYQQKGNNYLLILNQRTSTKIFLSNVILIKSDINYTKFYLEGGKEKIVSHTMKYYEPHLERHGFLRVHRSFMINPDHVKEYNQEKYFLMMSNGLKAAISRRRKSVLKHWR